MINLEKTKTIVPRTSISDSYSNETLFLTDQLKKSI